MKSQGPSGFFSWLKSGLGWRLHRIWWAASKRVFFISTLRRMIFRLNMRRQRKTARVNLGKETTATVKIVLDKLENLPFLTLETVDSSHASSGAPLAVGIVVPAFQAEEFLDDCLASVRAQIFQNWRCYIIDDGSTDRTAEIGANWERLDNRFRLIRHGKNGGLSAARNTGLREAIEPLVTFLDADDLLVRKSLERRVEIMQRDWLLAEVAGSWAVTLQVPEETTVEQAEALDGPHDGKVVDFVSSAGECPFNAHAPLMRTDLLRLLGGFDEQMKRGAEDWDLWQRVLRHGYIFKPAGRLSGVYRQRRSSMVRNDSVGHLKEADRLCEDAHRAAKVEEQVVVDKAASLPVGLLKDAEIRLHRASTYLGLCLVSTGDPEILCTHEIIGFLRPMTVAQFQYLDVTKWVTAGINRGLGLGVASQNVDEKDKERIQQLAMAGAEHLQVLVRSLVSDLVLQEGDVVDIRRCKEGVDVLLLAETSADVAPLAEIGKRLKEERAEVSYLNIDVVKGDEGAARWEETPFSGYSYGDVALGRVKTSKLIVRRPFGPVTVELIKSLGDKVEVVAVDSPERELELTCNLGSSLSIKTWESIDATKKITQFVKCQETRGPESLLTTNYGRLLHKEEGALDLRSAELFDELHNKHVGETVVIVGNGPSLNETPVEELGGVPTFGVNGIFYAADRFPDPITYYVVEDTSVFRENTKEIKGFETSYKFFPTIYRDAFSDDEVTDQMIFFRMNAGFYDRGTGTACHPRFSVDPRQRLYCGQSVTIINLQLAYWMGFSRVALIGMDFSYTIPDDVDRKGDVLTSNSDDVNHFHPDYFGKGKTWKDPKLDRVLVNYRLAGEMFAADGREIVNATVGGNLDIFRRMDLLEAIGRK